MTKKALKSNLDEACAWVNALTRQNKKLRERNHQLCHENIELMHEVRYLSDKIDCAISYCETKKAQKKRSTEWLDEVTREF